MDKKVNREEQTRYFKRENEKRLFDGLLTFEKYGFELLLVGQFVKEYNLKTPFKDGVSGED